MKKQVEGPSTQRAFTYPIPSFSTRHRRPQWARSFPLRDPPLLDKAVEGHDQLLNRCPNKPLYLTLPPPHQILETRDTATSQGAGRRGMQFIHHLSLEALLLFFLFHRRDLIPTPQVALWDKSIAVVDWECSRCSINKIYFWVFLGNVPVGVRESHQFIIYLLCDLG